MKKTDISGVYGIVAILCILSLALLKNGFYVAEGLIVLIILLSLTWRQYIPNVFAFILTYHWLQVISYIFYINKSWDGDLNFETESSVKAYQSALAGIVIMAIVINRVAYKRIQVSLLVSIIPVCTSFVQTPSIYQTVTGKISFRSARGKFIRSTPSSHKISKR